MTVARSRNAGRGGIAAGEVKELISRLPVGLHEPLRRGSERSGGRATRMSPHDFVTRVAERTGHSVGQARDDVRAVMVTLREAVGDDEFFDVAVQLPRSTTRPWPGAS